MESLARYIQDIFSDKEQSAEYKLQQAKLSEAEKPLWDKLSEEDKTLYRQICEEEGLLDLIYQEELLKFAIFFIKKFYSE